MAQIWIIITLSKYKINNVIRGNDQNDSGLAMICNDPSSVPVIKILPFSEL
jgi:hypothetical protein